MSNNQPSKPTKPIKERIEESMNILHQLRDLGIPDSDPSYKALSAKFNDWIRGGEAWVGHVDFYRWDRRAKVLLPTKPGTHAKCDFLMYTF